MNNLLSPLLLSLLLFTLAVPGHAELRFGPGPEGAGQPLDVIVAVVDDDVITRRELDAATARAISQLRQRQVPIPSREALERQVLEQLILAQLQARAAERGGIVIDDATLNAAIETLAQSNNMSLNQLRQAVENDGVSFAQFRDDVRRELMAVRLRQRLVDSQVQVSEQDVDSLQAQLAGQPGFSGAGSAGADREYRLAQILIAVPESASPQQVETARRQAEDVLTQLRQGADFRQMAVSVSADRQALEGGELGWRRADQVPTLFANVVPNLQAGQVSDLIRSPSGFHIVKLIEVRGGNEGRAPTPGAPMTADRERIREALLRRRADEEWELVLRRLRDEAYVEVRLPPAGSPATP
jgi:peptidyl-prolyl cis-trans isomerase SurA